MNKEWRESADLNPARLGLVLALLAAAMLRFWALPQGVPCCPGVDEPEVMERAVRMMKTGDFSPHFFDYPSLYMYVQAAVAVFRFVFGAMRGLWGGLAQAPTEEFYVWGRAVTAILGTATVWVVYRAGMRWGGRTALLAAVMVAVMPLHVRESHYVLTDVPATFLVMLTFLLSLRAHERSTVWSFALAGAAAGLAGATKYNGVLAVLMPLLACVMTPAAPPVEAGRDALDHRRHAGRVLPRRALHVHRSADVPQPVRAALVGIPRAAGHAGAGLADLSQAPAHRALDARQPDRHRGESRWGSGACAPDRSA